MSGILKPDLCVIGAGSAGLSVAAAAALMGVPVVLVEKAEMGGDCLNVGCVPSKAMIAAAERTHAAMTSAALGVAGASTRISFEAVHAHVQDVIRSIAPTDSVQRFRALGVNVIEAPAEFLDAKTVKAGEHTIKARRFVIATGSRPAVPAIPGLSELPILTNETIFKLNEKPSRLIVLGAGPIGVELAQAHQRLGIPVTLVDAAEPLAREDREAVGIVMTALAREGVTIRTGTAVASAERAGERLALNLADGSRVSGSHLLVAAGRKPTVDGLGLEQAGVRYSEKGIAVDAALRTSNSRVYAIGDVAGGPQFTHTANHHAGLVLRHALFRMGINKDAAPMPRVTYTDPEIASVGLSEAEAFAKYPRARILRWPFVENDRAKAERRVDGFVKAIVQPNGLVLGAVIVGRHAGELITPWTLLIANRLKVGALTSLVIPYPTLSEASKRAAVTFLTPQLRSPWLPRVLKLMRGFG